MLTSIGCRFRFSVAWACRFSRPLHGRLDLPGLGDVVREFPRARFVSISDDQRRPLPEANWTARVHHGLPLDLFRASAEQGSYLAFLGRLTAENSASRSRGSLADHCSVNSADGVSDERVEWPSAKACCERRNSVLSYQVLETSHQMNGFPPVTATVVPEVKLESGSASMT
jgi:hypothetical protein